MKKNIKLLIESLFDLEFNDLYNSDSLSIISNHLKYNITDYSTVNEINNFIYKKLNIEEIFNNKIKDIELLFEKGNFLRDIINYGHGFFIIAERINDGMPDEKDGGYFPFEKLVIKIGKTKKVEWEACTIHDRNKELIEYVNNLNNNLIKTRGKDLYDNIIEYILEYFNTEKILKDINSLGTIYKISKKDINEAKNNINNQNYYVKLISNDIKNPDIFIKKIVSLLICSNIKLSYNFEAFVYAYCNNILPYVEYIYPKIKKDKENILLLLTLLKDVNDISLKDVVLTYEKYKNKWDY